MTELLLLIDDYIKDVKEMNSYKKYLKYYNVVNSTLIDDYNELLILKEKFDEVMKYGKYHPDYKEVLKSYQLKRINYYENENVIYLKKYQKEVEEIVNSFLNKLTKEISTNIPIINELGLVSNSLGGLSCGNC